MQLTEHRNEDHLFVRKATAESVTIVDREIHQSIVLSATRIVDDIALGSPDSLDDAAIERILQMRPEVVLLGTGARAKFPPAVIQAAFLKRGVGLETMDNAAAARTFNVLAGEGRNVVAVFLLSPRPL